MLVTALEHHSKPNQDTYNFFDTNYTQIKANSKILQSFISLDWSQANDNGTCQF